MRYNCPARLTVMNSKGEKVDKLTEGGCLCGNVRYSILREAVLVGVCHCSDCRKFSGSAFSFLVAVEKGAFDLHGAVKTYNSVADSGRLISRSFCPHCGSSLYEESASHPDCMIVNAGTLDLPTSLSPSIELYAEKALPWIQLTHLTRFAKMSPFCDPSIDN
jgi:hypothetical protein